MLQFRFWVLLQKMQQPDSIQTTKDDPASKKKTDRLFLVLLILSGIVIGGAGLFFLYFHNPASTRWMPQCAFYRLSGFYCSGCGTTRALYVALHGNFLTAMRYNLLLFPLLILILVLIWKPRLGLRPWVAFSILIIIVLFWILRNIPLYPFVLLAPP